MPNAIPWNKENRERYGEEIQLRYEINKKLERLYDLEKEVKYYYYKDKYTLMASRLLEFKKHLLCMIELMKKKKCFQSEFKNELKDYTKKYEIFKNLK